MTETTPHLRWYEHLDEHGSTPCLGCGEPVQPDPDVAFLTSRGVYHRPGGPPLLDLSDPLSRIERHGCVPSWEERQAWEDISHRLNIAHEETR